MPQERPVLPCPNIYEFMVACKNNAVNTSCFADCVLKNAGVITGNSWTQASMKPECPNDYKKNLTECIKESKAQPAKCEVAAGVIACIWKKYGKEMPPIY